MPATRGLGECLSPARGWEIGSERVDRFHFGHCTTEPGNLSLRTSRTRVYSPPHALRTTASPPSLPPPSLTHARRTERQHCGRRALLEPGCDCRSESERPFCGRLDRRTSDCAGTGTHSTPQLQASSKQRVSPCQPIAHVTTLQSRASRRGIRLQGRKQAALCSAGRRRRGRGKSVGCNNKGEIVR